MALYVTNTVRVKPGHSQEYFAAVPKTIAIFEKHGVKFHGVFGAVGGEANVVVYLASVADFAFSATLRVALETV